MFSAYLACTVYVTVALAIFLWMVANHQNFRPQLSGWAALSTFVGCLVFGPGLLATYWAFVALSYAFRRR